MTTCEEKVFTNEGGLDCGSDTLAEEHKFELSYQIGKKLD